MLLHLSVLPFLLCTFVANAALLFPAPSSPSNTNDGVVVPNLDTLAPHLYGAQLNYRVAVGNKESPFQMQGLHVKLSDTRQQTPLRKRSTGIHVADLLQTPFFVNDKGEQRVALQDGAWEVTWGPKSPHGHLTCSFVATEAYRRNDQATSTLEQGRFFMYHRVWNLATLESERQRRRKIQSEAAKYLDERDRKIREITDEQGNIGSKVLSYAQAARSMNEYRSLGVREASFVPLYDDQVLVLESNCILSTRGQIFQMSQRSNNNRPEYIGESRVDFLTNKSNRI